MLTGQLPFQGKDAVSTLVAVVSHEPAPPARLAPEVPAGLSDLVMRLLAKEADRRPTSAAEVAEMLRAPDLPRRKSVPRSWRKVGRSRTLMLLAVGLPALGLLVWWLTTAFLRPETANGTVVRSDDLDRGTAAKALDPDRVAAEWVLFIGGVVRVNGQDREIRVAADLPEESFRLTVVTLEGNKRVSDAGLACFKGCTNLAVLQLAGTPVGDAGLLHFRGCTNLACLGLDGTQVGDTGLAHFRECRHLQQLNLGGTKVSDAGLAHFKECWKLTHLWLSGTQISDAGLVHFQGCRDLKKLNLQSTQVSDAGMVHFKDCRALTHLWLNGTQVGNTGLAHFKDCTNLRQLSLSGTQVSEEVWLTSRAARIWCTSSCKARR
jgi:hypothetical protein